MSRIWFVGAGLLLAIPLTHAHHSTLGFYDPEVTQEIEGIVKSVSMKNPHIHFVVEVTDETGEAVDWEIESSALSVLRTRGIDEDFMQPGDRVRVAGLASRRGRPEMSARNVLLSDGTEVLIALGSKPYFVAEGAELADSEFSESVIAEAQRTADGIFRVWSTVLQDRESFPMFKGNYPLTPEAEATRAAWDPVADELLSCWKKGMPLIMISPIPMEIQRDGEDIVILFEEDEAERRIYMSGPAPEGGSFLGRSTGRWEGDTLVVETVDIDAPDFDDRGVPQSSEIMTVERFTLSEDEERLDYVITVTDPVTFTRSFDLTRYWVWRPEIRRQPWRCEEPQ